MAQTGTSNEQDRQPARDDNEDINSSALFAEEQSAAELSARAAQRLSMLGEMTGGIAHDFRNILAVIDSSLRLLSSNTNDPEKRRMFINAARAGVDRGLQLTSQLLSLAKQREVLAQPNDANELLRNLDLFLKYGAGSAIRIVRDLAADLPKCLIHPAEFNSAILNLIINARDAMPDGGEIQISTARIFVDKDAPGTLDSGIYVQVTVADQGRGMSDEVKRKIFEPFFTTKGEEGIGLGLPQLYASMRRLGGYVNVTSEPRRGTRFELLFPIAGVGPSVQRRL